MEYNTSALCDIYLDQVDVVEPNVQATLVAVLRLPVKSPRLSAMKIMA